MGKITIVAYCGLLMTKVPDAKAFAKNFTYLPILGLYSGFLKNFLYQGGVKSTV